MAEVQKTGKTGNEAERAEVTQPVPEEAAPPKDGKAEALAKQRRRRRRALRSFLLRTISLALVIYVLFFHLVGLTMMPNRDMYPRLDAGDLLLFYRIERNPKFQDIVVIDKTMEEDHRTEEPGTLRKVLDWLGFRDPEAPKTQRFVCRVIAAPGDTVEISDERGLLVNGNAVIENNIFYPTQAYEEGGIVYPLKLGAGEYFVMADQRNGGMDSRYFGVVTTEEIQGVVITILRRNNL